MKSMSNGVMKVIQWTKCQHSKTSNGFFKAWMKKTTRLLITSLQWGHVITDLNRGLQLCLHVSGVFPEVSFQKNTAKENNTHIMGKVGPRWGNARHGTVLSAQGVQYDLLIIEALLLLGCHTSGDRETCRTVLGFPDFQCAACCLPRCESSVAMAGMCYTKTPKLWVPSRFGWAVWAVWTGWTLWAGENLLPRFQTKIFLQPSKLDPKTQTNTNETDSKTFRGWYAR